MSTAALMHDSHRLPDDAEPLAMPGWFAVAEQDHYYKDRVSFHAVRENNPNYRQITITVHPPETRYSRVESSKIATTLPYGPYGAPVAAVIAETLALASAWAGVLDEGIEEQRRAQEEQRAKERAEYEQREKERREKEQKAREEREQAVKERQEMLQWYVGSKFRLKRHHPRTLRPMRATVFGEIVDFRERYHHIHGKTVTMKTVSEKNLPMEIDIMSIDWMEVKEHESDRKYTTIIEKKEE